MTDELHRLWGATIKFERTTKGWSQAEFARRLDVRPSSVCRWETGASTPSDSHKMRVAEVLDRDVRLLFPLVRVGS